MRSFAFLRRPIFRLTASWLPTAVLIGCLSTIALTARAQPDPSAWLRSHHYAFDPAAGFEGPLADTLARELSTFHLILQAEGGSHYLTLYDTLQLAWLKFLNQRRGLTCFIGESGTSEAVLFNHYLQNPDSSLKKLRKRFFFENLYKFNSTLSASHQLYFAGIDFERPVTYMPALKALLPPTPPPATIIAAIGLIKQSPDSGYDCDATIAFNKKLKSSLDAAEPAYRDYLGKSYPDFEKIVRNNGSCKDALRNRNPHMADNFLALDKTTNADVYFGEFGEAHTILKNRVLASLIARNERFHDKVAVINLYCQDCSNTREGNSNWPFREIEADIQRYFLPLCDSDYTLFDLSGDAPEIARYKAYGQWLIVSKFGH